MNKQIKWGIILQYAQMALNVLVKLIYVPIMTRILGQNEYGLYNLASSIIGYLSLLSLGFGVGYIRFYSRYKKNDDEEGIKKLNGLYLIVFSIMGIVSLILGLILSFNVSWFFNNTYSAQELHIAKILMMFLTFNLAISFPVSIFTSFISSQEKFIFQKLINIINTVLSPVLCCALLFLGYGSIGMVFVSTVLGLIVSIINIFYSVKKLKMRFSFGKIDKTLLKEIAIFCSFIAVNQIMDELNWHSDKLILGKFVSSAAVGIYAIASTINQMYLSFSTAISGVFAPRVNKIVAENAHDCNSRLTDLMIKVGRIQLFVIVLILTGFIFFGYYFISVWAGPEYVEAYYAALLLIVPVTLPLIQNIGIEIRRAKNQHKMISIILLCAAIINIVISIPLGINFGVIGVAFGTTISLIINSIVTNLFYKYKIGLEMGRFWLDIIKILPAFILPVAVGILLNIFLPVNSILMFCLQVFIYTSIYCLSIFLFGLNKSEKDILKGFLIKKKKEKQK